MLGKPLTPLGVACVALGLAACAPSPLYVTERNRAGTVGEVPRDGVGEPLWDAIPGARAVAPPRNMPPAPGIAVTGAGMTVPPPPPTTYTAPTTPPPAYVGPPRAAIAADTAAPAPVATPAPRKKGRCHSYRRCD